MALVVMLVVLGGLLLVIGFVYLLSWQLLGTRSLHLAALPEGRGSTIDVIKISLSIVAGTGGAIALVVAYRRQKLLERDDAGAREVDKALRDRYSSAAQQLGDTEPAVRLAGVYAMAHLADEWSAQRQQCVDVLCAYLRLPWFKAPLSTDGGAAASDPQEQIKRVREDIEGDWSGEREVRRTICRVIKDHVRDSGSPSWSYLRFDLKKARLPGVSFHDAIFAGGADFSEVQFYGSVNFRKASFTEVSYFNRADFGHATVDFSGAKFPDGYDPFEGASQSPSLDPIP